MLFVLMPAKYILTTENKKNFISCKSWETDMPAQKKKREQKLSSLYEPRMILFRRMNMGITSEQKAIKERHH